MLLRSRPAKNRRILPRSRLLGALFLVAPLVACNRAPSPGPVENEGGGAVTLPPIEQVVDRHAPELINIPGVNAIFAGVTDEGRPCIRVGFVSLPHPNESRIPKELEGWPVVLEAIGEIRPLDAK